ncbi:MAG: hypothetical protein LC793_06635 [Thermomicrobia bacterium]|nr:hypothetical protein [Thermomicrobia bacterium]
MHTLSPAMILLLRPFVPLFSPRCPVFPDRSDALGRKESGSRRSRQGATDPTTNWQSITVADWYGKRERATDLTVAPEQIIAWFVRRWQMETGAIWAAFEEVRRHLGVETQRQWTDTAIHRTTPALLGLFSLVTLLAHPHLREQSSPIRQAAGYHKRMPTFADALAVVRREIWTHETFRISGDDSEMVKVPRALLERLTETLCSAEVHLSVTMRIGTRLAG